MEESPIFLKESEDLKRRNIAITIMVCVVAITILFIALLQMGFFTDTHIGGQQEGEITQVLVKVEYNSAWQGAYGDQTAITSWSGTGPRTVTLTRPSDSYIWIISANAQKMDGSSSTLRIMITKTDGTILKEGSTSAPYGVAQISYTVQD